MTPEERLYERYMELGRISSDADAERRLIRTEEIEPLLLSGVVLGDGEKSLVWEYQERVSFDHKKLIADKILTPEQVKEYTTVSVISVLVARKRDDEGRQAESRLNRARKYAGPILEAMEAVTEDEGISKRVWTQVNKLLILIDEE